MGRLDAVLGDGDHGDNLATGFRAVESLLDELPPDTRPGALLTAVGHRLVATVGGASGPLYGTALIEAGFRAGDADVVVTNHALLAIDALESFTVLPEHDAVVVDEAHELVDRVTGVATDELTAAMVERAAASARRLVD